MLQPLEVTSTPIRRVNAIKIPRFRINVGSSRLSWQLQFAVMSLLFVVSDLLFRIKVQSQKYKIQIKNALSLQANPESLRERSLGDEMLKHVQHDAFINIVAQPIPMFPRDCIACCVHLNIILNQTSNSLPPEDSGEVRVGEGCNSKDLNIPLNLPSKGDLVLLTDVETDIHFDYREQSHPISLIPDPSPKGEGS